MSWREKFKGKHEKGEKHTPPPPPIEEPIEAPPVEAPPAPEAPPPPGEPIQEVPEPIAEPIAAPLVDAPIAAPLVDPPPVVAPLDLPEVVPDPDPTLTEFYNTIPIAIGLNSFPLTESLVPDYGSGMVLGSFRGGL